MMRGFLLLVTLLAVGCGDSIVSYDSTPVSAEIPTDSAAEAFIRPFRQSMEADMARVVVRSEAPLLRGRPDSPLGSLMADLVLREGKRLADSVQVTLDVCVLNIGGFRIDLPEGDITLAHVYELMPFENVVNLILLTEEGVRQMAQHLLDVNGQPVAGMVVGKGAGGRPALEVGGRLYDGRPLWVVTSDYLADGGDHMRFFEERLQRIETGMKLREVLVKQMAALNSEGRVLTPSKDRRIITGK